MAPFFTELAQDRVLAEALWIAEPWDATREGYGLGRFPSPWLEWNDRFRDEARLFWKGLGSAKGFGLRLAGSPDIFVDRPYGSSVNYVACHDGFTARDLASWNEKHNQANQEENRDGSDWNHSDNFGVEGETSDPEVLEGRARRVRNLLASALLSQGTPLLLAGDELGRTQAGNNNAYCQDNAISWVNWTDPNPWPDPAWIRQVLEVRSQFPLPDSWEWIGNPQDDDQLLGVMLRSGVNSRVLVANRSSKAVRVELPIGTWRLRFDSGSGVGEEDQNWSDGIIEVGPSTLFVLDSSQIDPA